MVVRWTVDTSLESVDILEAEEHALHTMSESYGFTRTGTDASRQQIPVAFPRPLAVETPIWISPDAKGLCICAYVLS